MKNPSHYVLGAILTLALALFALAGSTPLHATAASPAPWSDSLALGMPLTPQPWDGGTNWDVQVHTRDAENSGNSIDTHNADHGADCGAPPATHSINTWQQVVFVCHDHVMTAIADGGYGMVAMTPNQLADWSGGSETVSWSVSTFHTDPRDWISISITPFDRQLALPFDEGFVDLQGMPKSFIQLRLDQFDGASQWKIQQGQDNFNVNTFNSEWPTFTAQTGIQPSKTVRTPFEFTFTKTGYTFRVAPSAPVGAGKVILSGNWPTPLNYTSGVVQFQHHSYNPEKCDTGTIDAPTCQAGTWHWSNIGLSSAVPYYMAKPTDHRVASDGTSSINFAAPAPSGAFLKFAGIGTIQVSYDGGKTFSTAQKPPMDASLFHDEHFTSYLSPVPAGATKVVLKIAGGWFGSGQARDFSLIALDAGSPPAPTPTPVTPTSTPVTPTPTPVFPTPTPGPIPLNHTPCMVLINGVMTNGFCDGTFTR
jgi:hypothetical protein